MRGLNFHVEGLNIEVEGLTTEVEGLSPRPLTLTTASSLKHCRDLRILHKTYNTVWRENASIYEQTHSRQCCNILIS